MFKINKFILLFLLFFFSSLLFSEVKLPSIISDNMVLQEGVCIPIWGKANVNEKIKISIRHQDITTIADANGKWFVQLKPIEYTTESLEMKISGENEIIIKNIILGQVWLASGQSNMWWTVWYSANPQNEIKNAVYPKIRLFQVNYSASANIEDDCKGKWVECSPDTVTHFSAVAYFFGRELHKELNQPIGMIHSSVGGTPIESWMPISTLRSDADYAAIFERYENSVVQYKEQMKKYDLKMAEWEKCLDKALAEEKPKAPQNPETWYLRPASLYNAMIAPLAPFAIKGVIWYQGESNANRAAQYNKLFPSMIADWRKLWHQEKLPFLFVQLANYNQSMFPEDSWAEIREVQLNTALSIPDTGMAVAIDIGEPNNIHPKNKQEVGRRLALIALAKYYERNIEYSGPIYYGLKIKNEKIYITFNHIGCGLCVKGDKLKGFYIADNSYKFYEADAIIDGNEVVVSNSKVKNPVAVRYGWGDDPLCNLYNKAGLPASPFRTDNFSNMPINTK